MYKIPDDAFQFYVSLGTARSYRVLAEHYHCTKRAILKRARRERWREQLRNIQQNARTAAIQQLQNEQTTMQVRHLAGVRYIQKRAIDVLKEKPLRSAMDAVKALALAQKEERSLFGVAQPPGELTNSEGAG